MRSLCSNASTHLTAQISRNHFRRTHHACSDQLGDYRKRRTQSPTSFPQSAIQGCFPYAEARPKEIIFNKTSVPLSRILGAPLRPSAPLEHELQYWRTWITGFVSDETKQIIKESTTWEDKGHSWYSSGEPRHRVNDRVLIFDSPSGYVFGARIIATTRTPILTPDGRHFSAYKRIRGSHRRKIGKPLLKQLREAGLIRRKSDLESQRKVTEQIWCKYTEVLNL
jgi:hypothetical protein